MPVYKSTATKNFTKIENEVLRDATLSMEARAIHALLLSLPTNWKIRKSWIEKETCWSRDRVTRAMGVLQKAGLLRKDPSRSEDGTRLAGVDWTVYANPQMAELVDLAERRKSSGTENQDAEPTTATKTEVEKERVTTTTKGQPNELPKVARVEEIWSSFNLFMASLLSTIDEMIDDGFIPYSVPAPRTCWVKQKAQKLYGLYGEMCDVGDCAAIVLTDWKRTCNRLKAA
ncbi:hypothetical protein GCM10023116_16070 [Kistimonas scapharcae]|uniref:Bacteriophage lambda Replication protein O N-terminal domain-containing protein n=1 Tax=Kistimonas scapharcae TaxID=1036133 RepID=A0ABP8UZI6_9GAMM